MSETLACTPTFFDRSTQSSQSLIAKSETKHKASGSQIPISPLLCSNDGLKLLLHPLHREISLHLPPLCQLMKGNPFPLHIQLGPLGFTTTYEFQFEILGFISLYGLYWHLPFKTLAHWVCIFFIFP